MDVECDGAVLLDSFVAKSGWGERREGKEEKGKEHIGQPPELHPSGRRNNRSPIYLSSRPSRHTYAQICFLQQYPARTQVYRRAGTVYRKKSSVMDRCSWRTVVMYGVRKRERKNKEGKERKGKGRKQEKKSYIDERKIPDEKKVLENRWIQIFDFRRQID